MAHDARRLARFAHGAMRRATMDATMPRPTPSRVIGMWTRAMLDELAPSWRTQLPSSLALTDVAALRGTEPYIAHEDMVTLWSHFADDHADPIFGLHFAERHADGGVGMFAHAAAHAPDFGTAARACIQLQRLIDTHAHFTLTAVDGGIAIRHIPPPGIARWPAHLAQSLAGGVVHLARTFAATRIEPRAAMFQHAAPTAAGTRAAAKWLGCDVTYEQPWNALVFDQATLDVPFRHADATQFAAIVAAASRTLADVAPPGSFLDEARAALRAQRGERPSVARLARALGLSERTLQRRLGEAGATFRQLVDEVRVEALADEQLKPQKSRATADALGFADPSSVRRLRKRWRGARNSSR
jgi:AraC-like DNA-binding protein